jgi:helix-turn-helix protein
VSDTRLYSTVAAAGSPIEALGQFWMLHPEQFEASTAAGYPHPFAGYFAGRGGVLGEVEAGIVEATFVIFPVEMVTAMWELGRGVHGAKGGSELYFQQAAEWAGRHLGEVKDLERFAELGERVLAVAPTAALPLYVGWRDLPRVEDPTGRAMQVLLVLRELRGAIHLAAMTAAGLGAKEAHLLNRGAEYCAFLGWTEPFPDVEHLRELRAAIEHTTNLRMTEIFTAALDLAEAEELAAIATAMNQAVPR